MIQKKNLQKASSLAMVFLLVCITVGVSGTAKETAGATLEITNVKGGIGAVAVTVKNIGTETAQGIVMSISVKGGMAGRINITHVCGGCGGCSNTIAPNETKTESTTEAGIIIGFGSITITTSAQATNAAMVEKTYTGFVLGPLVLISQ